MTAEMLARRQGRVLRVVLWINAVMFVVEASSGLAARSTALLGDSLDMLGDALAYGATLFALHRGPIWKGRAATLKGVLMAATAVGVLSSAVWRGLAAEPPAPLAIGGIGLLALAANAACLVLLTRHRDDDVNMSSAWVCSRNDLVANVSVIAAGGLVALTGSFWPDLAVGVAITLLFARSALMVLRAAARSSTPTRKIA
jgi:Co/Zn/Cd efflux system component